MNVGLSSRHGISRRADPLRHVPPRRFYPSRRRLLVEFALSGNYYEMAQAGRYNTNGHQLSDFSFIYVGFADMMTGPIFIYQY
jgi:hypothetical protein